MKVKIQLQKEVKELIFDKKAYKYKYEKNWKVIDCIISCSSLLEAFNQAFDLYPDCINNSFRYKVIEY